MKKRIVLNFWHALLLLIVINCIYVLIGLISMFIFKDYKTTNSFQITGVYLYIILYIPFTFWFAKKTNINIKDSLFIPDLSNIIRPLVIVLLLIIVLNPLSQPEKFIETLTNSRLRITGTSLRPWFPWLDFKLLVIGPIIEELFFRGLLLKNFLKKYSPIVAIMLSSLLFGIHHYSNFIGAHALSFYNIVFYIAVGVVYGLIYYKTNSLIIVSLAHILWNASTFLSWDYVELDTTKVIIHSAVYITAFGLIIFQINKLKNASC
jgi:membrane protease YdiL (CAAX protease family)